MYNQPTAILVRLTPFVLTYSGFVDGGTEVTLSGIPVAATSANQLSPAGSYDIVASGGACNKYHFSYASGTLTIKNRHDDPSQQVANAFTPYE